MRAAEDQGSMLRSVQSFVKQYRLFSPGDRVLAGVSGGADSVAMLHALSLLAPASDLDLVSAHLDHRIRGENSTADARFVRRLCTGLGVRCILGRSDVPCRARRKHISLEMAAREARYEFFARAAKQCQASVVATAHTADDQAETVILNLARGAGPAGLGGIPRQIVRRGLRVVRPLLGVTRKQVLAYLNANRLSWREDESNREEDHLRNRVRHQVLPLLERALNPKIRQALARTADVMREEDLWADQAAADALAACLRSDGGLDLTAFGSRPAAEQRRVARGWLTASGVPAGLLDFDTVMRLVALAQSRRASGEVPVGAAWSVRKQYTALFVQRRRPGRGVTRRFRRSIGVPGETLMPAVGLRVRTSVAPGVVKPKASKVGRLPAKASLSRAAVGRKKVFVRFWQDGDRMCPLGLKGSKKLQDVFVDHKVPLLRRRETPVFECGGQIVWVPGYRVARGWEMPDATSDGIQISVTRIRKRTPAIDIDSRRLP